MREYLNNKKGSYDPTTFPELLIPFMSARAVARLYVGLGKELDIQV